jgi:hypothetical protein
MEQDSSQPDLMEARAESDLPNSTGVPIKNDFLLIHKTSTLLDFKYSLL